MTSTITIKPTIKEIIEKIKLVIDNPDARGRVFKKAVAILSNTNHAAKYPPETYRNSPPGTNGRWYERGFGTRYLKRNSSIGGNPFFSNIGNAGRNTSQEFQDSWQTDIQDFTASVFTEVTYAPFLLDESKRPAWTREVGWQTLGDISDEFTPVFEKIILDEIDNDIEKI